MISSAPPGAIAQCTSSANAPVSCCGDLNDDGRVDDADWEIVMGDLGCDSGCCIGDANYDGITDCDDVEIVDMDMRNRCEGPRPVPLIVWDSASALPVGKNGASFADIDLDGYPDAAIWRLEGSNWRRRLFFNRLSGSSPGWAEGCLLANTANPETFGYGVALGDYNNDGYPDYVNEPRSLGAETNGFLFLVNAGCSLPCDPGSTCGSNCTASVANFLPVQCCLDICNDLADEATETNGLADVDGDGDLDVLVTAYTSSQGGGDHGTFLFKNIGHDPNACTSLSSPCSSQVKIWRVVDATADANLEALEDVGRPEGSYFADYDQDGDADLAVQDVIQQNVTTEPDDPVFSRLFEADSGLDPFPTTGEPEEGLLLVDLDMDGDLDVLRNRNFGPLRANRSRGDGTFETTGDQPLLTGSGHGLSAADWDNDGDLDVTCGNIWIRNRRIEGWTPSSPPFHPWFSLFWVLNCPDPDASFCGPQSSLPSWCDVDRDGDVDCARSRFQDAATSPKSVFYRNGLYSHGGSLTGCDEQVKRFVNVRPVRAVTDPNGPTLPRNRDFSENEPAARVELVIRGDTSSLRRVQSTSTAAGYLTQNEYPLHFGLPTDPEPEDPNEDLRFEPFVDLVKNLPERDAAEGPWRIDWTVNDALVDINLASLYVNPSDPNTFGRPLTVYRDGRVRYGGQSYDPIDPNTGDPNGPSPARMFNLGGPLLLPVARGGSLATPTTSSAFVGVQFTKAADSGAVRVREFILDGQLASSGGADTCPYNLVVIDVTDPNNPFTIGGLSFATVAHNRRTFVPIPSNPSDPNAFVLPEASVARTYEVRANVTAYRANSISDTTGLQTPLGITVIAGLRPESSSGKVLCTESMETQTSAPGTTPITVRLSRKAERSIGSFGKE